MIVLLTTGHRTQITKLPTLNEKGPKSIVELIKNIEGVKEVREIGKTILIQTDGLKALAIFLVKLIPMM